MTREFIVLLHYSLEQAAWLSLAGWEAPADQRDALAALRHIAAETDRVLVEQGEPELTPYVLIAGTLASESAPHVVTRSWRLAPELADRLLQQVEQRGAAEAIDDADELAEDEVEGLDLGDLMRRAYAPAN
ncbi:MAG: hypothetical protein ACOYLX_05580 [Burkholderiaceae bacterium]|jgi:hypothetical protein